MDTPGTVTPTTAPSVTTTTKSMSVFVWNQADYEREGMVNGTVKVALGVLAVGFLFIILAFSTPAWLEAGGDMQHPKFIRIGLWEGCFDGLRDDGLNYDNVISGCWWLLAEELYHLNDLIFQPFFVAVQFFFTICFITMLIACVLVPMYLLCFGPEHHNYVLLIQVIGLVLLSSALFGSIAVIVFGAMGDSRAWMPDWQNNYLSWSFAFAVVGVVCEYVSGVLFVVEGRVQSRKRKVRESYSGQTMETKA